MREEDQGKQVQNHVTSKATKREQQICLVPFLEQLEKARTPKLVANVSYKDLLRFVTLQQLPSKEGRSNDLSDRVEVGLVARGELEPLVSRDDGYESDR